MAEKKATKEEPKKEVINVRPLNRQRLVFEIVGIVPYVQHAFGQKTTEIMRAKHEAGAQAGKRAPKPPRDFDANYEDAIHYSKEGWMGIPAPAFRAACISACRTIGYKMTHAKLAMFFEADGFDRHDQTPLIKITGKPEKHLAPVRNDDGSADLRCRPMWAPGWSAKVRIAFDADMFTASDVANLFQRAGLQVGIGEGRPDSKNSSGLGWGLFDIKS